MRSCQHRDAPAGRREAGLLALRALIEFDLPPREQVLGLSIGKEPRPEAQGGLGAALRVEDKRQAVIPGDAEPARFATGWVFI